MHDGRGGDRIGTKPLHHEVDTWEVIYSVLELAPIERIDTLGHIVLDIVGSEAHDLGTRVLQTRREGRKYVPDEASRVLP